MNVSRLRAFGLLMIAGAVILLALPISSEYGSDCGSIFSRMGRASRCEEAWRDRIMWSVIVGVSGFLLFFWKSLLSKNVSEGNHDFVKSKNVREKGPQVKRTSGNDFSSVKEFFLNYFKQIRKIGRYEGRSSRREYWGFILCHLLIASILGALETQFYEEDNYPLITGLYSLALFPVWVALHIRRLHDVGSHGLWWLFDWQASWLILVLSGGYLPFLEYFPWTVYGVLGLGAACHFALVTLPKGSMGENRYGPNPNTPNANIGVIGLGVSVFEEGNSRYEN